MEKFHADYRVFHCTKSPYPIKRLEAIRIFSYKVYVLSKVRLEQVGVCMVVGVDIQYMPA